MARTKQVAAKNTGGQVPRKTLAQAARKGVHKSAHKSTSPVPKHALAPKNARSSAPQTAGQRKKHRYRPLRNSGARGDKEIPEEYGAKDQEASFCKAREGDRPRFEDRLVSHLLLLLFIPSRRSLRTAHMHVFEHRVYRLVAKCLISSHLLTYRL
jgi:hypothetical protein